MHRKIKKRLWTKQCHHIARWSE